MLVWCRGIYLKACLLLVALMVPMSVAALEPMSESGMDSVHAQSGIALGLDNVGIYNARSGFSYEDTTVEGNTVVFETLKSLTHLETEHPFLIRILESQDGIPLVAFELLSPVEGDPALMASLYVDMEGVEFAGNSVGNLYFTGDPPTAELMGFMEEFALYLAPFNTLDALDNFDPAVYIGDGGIGLQLDLRTGIKDFLWDYSLDETVDDEFYLRGIQMAGNFDDVTGDPVGRFRIGNLDTYDKVSNLGPATFQVLSDAEGGYVRFNLPMEGSARIDEIGMYTLDEGTGNYVAPDGDGFGPMIIDDMQVHHFQLDFRTQ